MVGMTNDQPTSGGRLDTFIVIARFKPDTDMSEVFAVVAEEQAQVEVLKRNGHVGSIHISMARGTVFIETFARDAAEATATVDSLPMSKWWDLDLYPTVAASNSAPGRVRSTKALSASEVAYLATQTLGSLATVNKAGRPQNSPVSFTYNEATGTIDIGGRAMGTTRKFGNVAATGVASIVIDDVADPVDWAVRGVEIRGEAEALTDVEPPSPYFSREIVRIHPSRVISWGLKETAS